jgi:rhodanese-related sulfurtransferase
MFQSNRTVFIDARYPEEYTEGHIKGALLLPFEDYDNYVTSTLKNVPKDAAIVAYCGEEDCDLSLYLARLLRDEEGYTEVYTFYGGFEVWVRAGMPVEAGIMQPQSIETQER